MSDRPQFAYPGQSDNPETWSSDQRLVLRVLDANLNRATEALRVLEDYARFIQNNRQEGEMLKNLRHQLHHLYKPLGVGLLESRDSIEDVGRDWTSLEEKKRSCLEDVRSANWKRVQEALRSLEEFTKLLDEQLAQQVKAYRYQCYELETGAKRLGFEQRRKLEQARLYVLIDGGQSLSDFAARSRAILQAGAPMVQLRDKQLEDRELVRRGRTLRAFCDEARALLIINDRVDLALAVNADGVHVGQSELPLPDVRKIVGHRFLVGCSTHNITELEEAQREGADYVGCGPAFASKTKEFQQLAGLAYLREVATCARVPAFAIGGITLENLSEVLATGATRVAVSHAIWHAADPAEATRAFLERLTAKS